MRNYSEMLCQTYNVIFRSFGQSHFRSFSFSIFFLSRHHPRPQRVFRQSLSLLRREEGISSLFWERKYEIKERRNPASCCNWQGFIFLFYCKKSTLCCLESVNSKTVRFHLHIQYVAVCLSIWYHPKNALQKCVSNFCNRNHCNHLWEVCKTLGQRLIHAYYFSDLSILPRFISRIWVF